MDGDEDAPPLAVPIADPDTSTSSPKSPVGVTVITGFLGAGKSTLVNYILNGQHGKRFAVILNEFGEEIGVERAMINEEDGAIVEEWVELANGCVCCTVKHSLVQALEQLVRRKDRLDHILLETTGLADPAPLVNILWLDDQLESEVRLDSIITVVDAKNLQFQLKEHQISSSFPEALVQIAFADVVILNKIDLLTQDDPGSGILDATKELEKQIYEINSIATIIHSVRCQVDLHRILNRNAYGSNNMSHMEELLEIHKSRTNLGHHDRSMGTLCINEDQPLDLIKVQSWLEDLLWEKKFRMDVYRCKAVLNIHGSQQIHSLQAVRELYEIVPARSWNQGEKRTSRIVFIGHSLDEKVLSDSIRTCTVTV